MKLRIMLPLLAVGLLALAAPAAMASSTSDAYGKPTQAHSVPTPSTHVLGTQSSGGTTNAPSSTPVAAVTNKGGDLPFTGFDLLLVGGAGLALLAFGFGLRRMTGRNEPLS